MNKKIEIINCQSKIYYIKINQIKKIRIIYMKISIDKDYQQILIEKINKASKIIESNEFN